MDSGQSFMFSAEDLWQRAHLKFSLTGWDVGKRSRLKNMISKSRFSIDVKESVGMVAKVWASPRFEICRAARQGYDGHSVRLIASSVRLASASSTRDEMACWRPRDVLDRLSVDDGPSASRIGGTFDCRRCSARAANWALDEIGWSCESKVEGCGVRVAR